MTGSSTNENRILITGGASGLGQAIAVRYAQAHYRVCIVDVNEERGGEVLNTLRQLGADALYLRCDVTSLADLQNVRDTLIECWGGVDIVVNNAGIAGMAGAIEVVPLEAWDKVLDINLKGVVRGCHVFTALFKLQGHGHFVNVASAAGLINGPLMSAYNAAKAGVISVSETLSKELESNGIYTTVVCPAFFKTNLGETIETTSPKLEQKLAALMEQSTITADDIAEQIYCAVENRTLYVFGHKAVKRAWLLKRLLPGLARKWI